MIPLNEALAILDGQSAGRTVPSERLPVDQALGRVCVEDQVSKVDVPPFDKSAMDGYAIPAGEVCDAYEVIETVSAGTVPTRVLGPGQAVKIMTGAPVPAGAGRVVMIEDTECEGTRVRITRHTEATHICPQGEDVRAGEVVLRAPVMLGPAQIGNLVSVGITAVRVSRPVRVAILTTGDEIVQDPGQLGCGKIMDSNGPMLEALCRGHGLEIADRRVVPDTLGATIEALDRARTQADLILLSGGVSVGDFDYVAQALLEPGWTIHFDRVAVKPGKPTTLASAPGCLAIGLPGNPVAVFLMFHLFALRAARSLAGLMPASPFVRLVLAQDARRRDADRQGLLPCRFLPDGRVETVPYHGTAHLRALLDADGFVSMPHGVTHLGAGASVEVLSVRGPFA